MEKPKLEKNKIKREYSAGGVVFKKENDGVFWLVIQPKASESEHWRKGRWQLPKGWIDEGETGPEAALRETKEEGGVEAELVKKVDNITIFFYNEEKERVVKNIAFFLMRCLGDLKEGFGPETERVLWLPFKKAWEKLTFKSEKEILERAREILKKGEGQPRLI
jgi:8-oxo-dGTP pyrophosphatase MutT (NUDIX family)